jgi:glycine/D-amino acid oxidase-like deaminating enzyme
MKIARRPEHEEQLRQEVARGRRLGVDIDLISPAEARRLVPFLETTGIRAISYTASDVYLEPSQLPLGYARAAEKLGATLLEHTAVTGIDVDRGRVSGVVTDRGRIAAPVVVDAAGAWSRVVGALARAHIPVVPTRHQLVITEPIAGVGPALPIVRVIDANIYLRPDGDGLLVGGYEPDPVQYDMGKVPTDFQVKDLLLDLGPLRRLAGAVADQLPVLRELSPREHRGGLPTMTPDGRQLVGPVPAVAGLYVASGCCVGGLSISPAIGEGLAAWIATGEAPFGLDFLGATRFGNGSISEDRLLRESRWHYAHRYATH